jgi:hypothetical protein
MVASRMETGADPTKRITGPGGEAAKPDAWQIRRVDRKIHASALFASGEHEANMDFPVQAPGLRFYPSGSPDA